MLKCHNIWFGFSWGDKDEFFKIRKVFVFTNIRTIVLGNMIMYPSINRMGNYGSNPITYGPPKPSYGGPGKIPGYDLRVSYLP